MKILTQIPIGSKLRVKKTGELVVLEEIRNYPTRYKTVNESGNISYYKTFEAAIA